MKEGKPVAGLAAGGHYDPATTGRHEGPGGKGHLGDLPALTVGADGKATAPVTAPRLKVADVLGRSLMVHAGGDNYADSPAPLGGGGGRIACGVIK
jgi:Cu-Zn family superoxide dismutase